MPRYPDDVYVPAGPSYDAPRLVQGRRQRPAPGRLKLFAILFGLVAIAGLAFTFLRPPVYLSTAIVLVREAAPVGGVAAGAPARANVAMHAQAFGNPALLADVYAQATGWRRAGAEDQPPARLSARALPEADAVELRAEGRKAALLPALLDAWISGYEGAARDAREASAAQDDSDLRQKVESLDEQIAAKTAEVEGFRTDHGIVTQERGENSKIAMLQGLHGSLDRASAEQAAAEAELAAIKEALAAGRPYVRSEDKNQLAALENQVAELRSRMQRYADSYTPAYMELDTDYRDLSVELDAAEKRLADAPAELQRNALREAEQRAASARSVVITLKAQLAEGEKDAQQFDEHLGEYRVLRQQLDQLQGLKQVAQKRLVDASLSRRGSPVQLSVLQEPVAPDSPERPLYARDAGISVAGALLVAIVGVLIYEFLAYVRRPQASAPYPWPVIVSAPGQQLPPGATDAGRLAEPSSPAALPGRSAPRELSQAEVGALFSAGPAQTRALVPLLLSGVKVDELGGLRWSDVDLAGGWLQVPAPSPRALALHPALGALWPGQGPSGIDGPVLPFLGAAPEPREAVDRLLYDAADDAGLAYPHEIGAQTLRHTYLCYLVRQGLRLSDLKGVAGGLEPAELDLYRRLSPPGAKAGPEQVRIVYPLPALG